MPPKKPAAKGSKKEEAVDIPKTSLLPDGKRTYFVGQWSAQQHVGPALSRFTKFPSECGDQVVVLSGTHSFAAPQAAANSQPTEPATEGAATAPAAVPMVPAASLPTMPAAPADKHVIALEAEGFTAVRSLSVGGYSAFVAAPAPKAAAADEGADGGEEGGAGSDSSAIAKRPKADQLVTDRTVVVTGDVKLTGWRPAPVVAPPPVAAPTSAAAPAPKKGKVQVKAEEEVAAAVVVPPPVEEKGVAPSTWPTVTITAIAFAGTVTLRALHAVFKRCHFSASASRQVNVHQYCKVTFEECTFAFSSTAALYAFPLSVVQVSGCRFGVDPPAMLTGAAGHNAEDALKQRRVVEGWMTTSIAIHADDAQVSISKSYFSNVGFGVVLHDKCAGSQVTRCGFDEIMTTAIVCGAHNAAELRGNTVKRCGYYGLRFLPGSITRALVNTVNPPVKVDKGANPFLHSNVLAVNVISDADPHQPYMSPVY